MKRPRPEWGELEIRSSRCLEAATVVIVTSPSLASPSSNQSSTTTIHTISHKDAEVKLDTEATATATNTNGTILSSMDQALRNALAGAMSGAVSRTATAPIERIKLMLQLQGSSTVLSSPSSSPSSPSSSSLLSLSTISSDNRLLNTVTRNSSNNNSSSSSSSSIRNNLTNSSTIVGDTCKQQQQQRQSWNAWKVCRHIYTTEGGTVAFWRGNTPNVLRQAGGSALNFMLMDSYKSTILSLMEQVPVSVPIPPSDITTATTIADRMQLTTIANNNSIVSSFLSGGLAGGTTTTILYPIEFIRTRLALDTGRSSNRSYPNGMRDVFHSIVKTDGISGLYQGYGIALAGVILYRALHLGGYDACKTELVHRRKQSQQQLEVRGGEEDQTLSVSERFVIAQFVSISAGIVCYPIDSVRRRLMMQAGEPTDLRLYTSSLHAFYNIFKFEGVQGFYLGIGPNIVRSAISGSLLLVSYDMFRGR